MIDRDPLVESAAALDAADALGPFRSRFALPAPVYLSGHSLGAQPLCARAAIERHLDKWGAEGVSGHFSGGHDAWASMEDSAPGGALVGARDGEVVYMNSLTVNLHLLMTAFYTPDGARDEVLIEENAFPSDDYAVQTHVKARGGGSVVKIAPRKGEDLLREEDLVAQIRRRAADGTLALVLLPGVQYLTGQVLPMGEIARVCREVGVPLGLDLAHAVGNVPLKLHEWGVDFAVWCSYKYLNSGPGSIAGAFVHEKHGDCAGRDRLAGWWGYDRATRFEMKPTFIPQSGAYGFQVSNPSIFALAPVIASLRLFEEAGGIAALRQKSILLIARLEAFLSRNLSDKVTIISPSDPRHRGNQLSLRLSSPVREVQAALRARGIVTDVREPDVMRVAAAPLYNSFADIDAFVEALNDILTGTGAV